MISDAGRRRSDAPFSHHVLQRTIVLPEQRVLFLPVPKAACTSILLGLAPLAGLNAETFARSTQLEVSPALAVHDMDLWPPQFRLGSREPDERAELLAEDGWLRFTVVRHPATRLWSAWHSKLLLREPRFFEQYGDRPWFPREPEDPAQLVEDFRLFVAAVGSGEADDVHWAVQSALVSQLPLTRVGRVEALPETLALLERHLGAPLDGGALPRENATPLALPPHAYDAATLAIVDAHYREDFDSFDYQELEPQEDMAGWEREAATQLDGLRATIEQNARIAQLHASLRRLGDRAAAAEQRLERASSRQPGGSPRSSVLTNLEERADFNVRWSWAEADPVPGLTAVLRVRNEARPLPWVLPPLLRAVRDVIVIDNGSTDGTGRIAREIAAREGAAERLQVRSYPFAVARCGDEHLGTPAASVHSLAYFYNWAFAHVRTSYALKWDGDMVLTDAAVGVLRDLAWQLEATQAIIRVPRYPLYVADDRRAFLDTALRNCEPWGWPNRPGYSFVKAMEWELPLWGGPAGTLRLPDWSCVELKHLDADEFGHWSHHDFGASPRTQRKRREWEVFHALVDGGALPEGVVAIEAPPGVHVIEHVRETWLPLRGRSSVPIH